MPREHCLFRGRTEARNKASRAKSQLRAQPKSDGRGQAREAKPEKSEILKKLLAQLHAAQCNLLSVPRGKRSSCPEKDKIQDLECKIAELQKGIITTESTAADDVSTDEDSAVPVAVANADLEEVHMFNTIGRGGFSVVRLARVRSNNPPRTDWLSIKCLDKTTLVANKALESFATELKLLQQLSHPHIIEYVASIENETAMYVLTELAPAGDLFQLLNSCGTLTESEARFYASNIGLALEYMHSCNVVYRDLKPENILVVPSGHVKICDLGCAKELTEGKTYTMCGTVEYMAPEVVAKIGHDKSSDFWSFGVLIFEMINAYTPWANPNRINPDDTFAILNHILTDPLELPLTMEDSTAQLLHGLLHKSTEGRLSRWDKVREHMWFDGFDWEAMPEPPINTQFHAAIEDVAACHVDGPEQLIPALPSSKYPRQPHVLF